MRIFSMPDRSFSMPRIPLAPTLRFMCFILINALAHAEPWVIGYYANSAAWPQYHPLPQSEIDFSIVTHVIDFAAKPNTNGTLDTTSYGLTTGESSALVGAAHAAGRKALVCVGGGGTETNFLSATNNRNYVAFAANIISLVTSRGYDGVDIDWEPLTSTDFANYSQFILQLKTDLVAAPGGPYLLTIAIGQGNMATFLATIATNFDQIHVETYDMGWDGFLISWFNSAIHGGGLTYPIGTGSAGTPVETVDQRLGPFLTSGIPLTKLSIGVPFYGYIWTGGGIVAPRQTYSTVPSGFAQYEYNNILDLYPTQSSAATWDTVAQTSWFGINTGVSATDKFITFDNAASCAAKTKYALSKGLGGVFIWNLSGTYIPTNPPGQQLPLLLAIGSAISSAINSAVATPPTSLRAGSVGGGIQPCDVNHDGYVNIQDVQLAINMDLGLLSCGINIDGTGACDIVDVQRVINTDLGQPCVTGPGVSAHSASLWWVASTSPNVIGYNVYRGDTLGGPYTRLNSVLVEGAAYTDTTVQPSKTYYYVVTAVDNNNNESSYSTPPAQSVVPSS